MTRMRMFAAVQKDGAAFRKLESTAVVNLLTCSVS